MNEERIKRNSPWEPVAAFVCFAGAVLSFGIGFVLTTGWVVNADLHPFLHGVGLTLLIIGIPILILGGHCLDLMERRVKKADAELPAQRKGGTKPLHVVVMLLGSVFVLCGIGSRSALSFVPGARKRTKRIRSERCPTRIQSARCLHFFTALPLVGFQTFEAKPRLLKMLRNLASQSIPNWNQIIVWLKEI
jgi:hypothetical protein